MTATITSIAHYVPPDIYDNKFFESYLDTNDDWIVSRTGIRERHILKEGGTSDLIVPAAKKCLEQRGITSKDIDLILVTTISPDHFFPSTAALVHERLGCDNTTWGFDLSGACSGFIYGIVTALQFIESGQFKRILLCGSDKMSSIANYQDRNTCILFGDAAGVCIIEESDDPELGIQDHLLRMDGKGKDLLYLKAGGSRYPTTIETVQNGDHFLYQDGQAVFKVAVKGMADISVEIMQKNDIKPSELNWFVPHQANMRIIKSTADRMGIDKERVMINIDKYGNTTSATIPMCISEWYQAGKIKKGDKIILSSFGAGYTWGAVYLRWNMNK